MKPTIVLLCVLVFLLLFLTVRSCAQSVDTDKYPLDKRWGVYAQGFSETFYNRNFSVSIGAAYNEFRLGGYYQHAVDNDGIDFTRRGVFFEAGVFNVHKIAYLSVGLRIVTTNKNFVEVIPHGTLSWRVRPWFDIPLSISMYEGFTGIAGIRFIFK